METLRIELINPKAINFLNGLADLNLISIKKDTTDTDFVDLLTKLRSHNLPVLSDEEILAEVELVRKHRYAD
ncbi:MAG: hypothetical protein RO257_16320 [Candidatus Kapabacteria bacterium]|nr:hypothetical protein [Candidatus Kapabacteria bacterium]